MPIVRRLENFERKLQSLALAKEPAVRLRAVHEVLEHLDDMEDYYLALLKLTDIYSGNSKPVSLEDVMEKQGVY
jgi:predicted DNA-binding protein